MKTSEKNDSVYAALFDLSKVVMNITRSKENDFFKSKYVPLDQILDIVCEPLAEEGLMLTSSPSFKKGVVTVETRIVHPATSQWVSVSPAAPVVPTPIKKNSEVTCITPQGVGAAITYLRRYGLMSLLGLAETDDDGNLASGTPRDERESWTGPLDQLELTKELRGLWGKLEKCQDHEKIDPILWGYSEVIAQCKADLSDRWDGTDGVKGIQTLIDTRREKLAPRDEPLTPEALIEEVENRISGIDDLDDLEEIRKEYDEHPGLALPDIREKVQDIFNVKEIEIQTEPTPEDVAQELAEQGHPEEAEQVLAEEQPETENPEPEEKPEFNAKEMFEALSAKIGTFDDFDELAAWSEMVAEDVEAIAKVSIGSARELTDRITDELQKLDKARSNE